MIAGANESLQDPERVGNGLKSIAINMAGLKTSTKDGSIELNKTALALKKIAGIDIFTDSSKTSVKDMVTIIDEVKGKWGELSETQQLALSEAIAGKTQSSVFNALMSGWGRVKQFQQEYKDGFTVGSAERENAIYLDSIAGKWNTLKENMKSLVTNNISSSFVKDLLEGLNKVVLVVDKISTGLGKIGSVGAIAGIASFIKTMANFDDFKALDFTEQLGIFGKIDKLKTAFSSLGSSLLSGDFKGGISGIISGLKNMVTQSGLATVAMGALKAVLTGFAVAGVIAGIVAIGKALYDNIHKTEQTIATSKELQQNIQDEITTLNTQKTSLSQIATEYDKLSRKSNKTVEEMQRLSELKKQIAEIAPDLVVGYDANNDPILALKGSLTSYIAELDVAIDKQKDLYNTETYVQASAIMEENAKSMETWNTHLVKAGGSFELWQSQVDEASGKVVSSGKSLIKMSEQIAEADNHKKEVMLENLASISRQQQENAERDATVQQHYLNQWVKNTQLTSEQAKQSFSNFFTTLDWGTFDEAGATELSIGLKKLESVTATTTSAMGQKFQDMTAKANKAFKDTGAIQTYGKALQEIALDSGKFDMASWSNYLNEVNQRFQDGVMPVEQYQHALKYMADTLGDLTGIDAGTWLQSLIGTGDYASAFENMNSGLTKFLGSYKKTVGDIRSGDSLAMALKDQFTALEGFEAQLNRRIEADIPITVDWLIEQKDDLPKQIQTLIDAINADGDVNEIEEKLLVAITAELKNEGQISNDILTTLNDVIHGTLDGYNLDDTIEIGGVEFTIRQLQSLVGEVETLEQAYNKLKGLDFENDGAEELATQIEEVKEALNGIDSTHIRVAMDAQGFEKKEEIEMMSEAIEQIDGKEAKTQFIADTADYFRGASSVEEAIESLPPEIKLRYHIGVEGDEYLEGLDAKLKALPPEIQTMITVDGTYSLHDLEEIKAMCDVLGNETVTMLLSLEGAPEALADCSSLEERLQKLAELVAKSGVELENGDEVIDKIDAIVKELKKLDGEEAETEVTVESETKGVQETKETLDELDGKQTESNHKASSDSEEVDGTKEKTDDLDGKQTQSNHTAKSEDSELDETEKKIEKLTQDTHGKITVHADKREVVEAQIDKDRLEVDGKAITRVQVDGMGYYDVAINDKGQLEVNGKAITNVEVNDGEQLKFAINDKGQLEVNGIALTNVDILGSEKLVTAKQDKEDLETDGESNTKMNVDNNDFLKTKAELAQGTETEVRFTLKQTIDSILAKLGLNKSEANVTINIECNDQATHILSNIKNTYGKIDCKINVESSTATNAEQTLGRLAGKSLPAKTLTVIVTSLDNALSKMDSLATKTIPSKTFSVTANNLASTMQQVAELSARTIANKAFSVTCNAQSATSSLSYLANVSVPNKAFSVTCNASGANNAINSVRNANIPNKSFTISCSDNASSKVNKVKGLKISNKSFTISATDRASGTIASIKRQLAGISGKTVTVTVRKNTIYTSNGTGAGTGYVSVGEPRVANNVSTLNNAVKLADASGNALGTQVSAMAEGTSGMVSAMAKAKANIDTGLTRKALKYNVDLLKNMDAILTKLQANLDKVNAKQELAFGNSKAKLLQEEISLLTQQQKLTSTNISNMQGMAKKLKSSLKDMGFKFKDDGSISNYNKKIVAMEEKVAKLKSTAEKSEKTASKDKATKKQKSKATADQKAYEKAQKELDKMKQYTDEYLDLTFNQIPEAQAEWYELKSAIADAKAEMIKAKQEAKTLKEDLVIEQKQSYIDRNMTKADNYMNLAENAKSYSEYIKYMNKANTQLQSAYDKQEDILAEAKSRMKDNRGILKENGFTFDSNGNTKNAISQLQKLAKSLSPAEYEAIYAIYLEYLDDLNHTLPETEAEMNNLKLSMEDNAESAEEFAKKIKELNEEAQDLELAQRYNQLSDALDILDTKMNGAFGKNKISNMKEQLSLLSQLKIETGRLKNESQSDANSAKGELQSYGVKFDSNGNMSNLQGIVKGAGAEDKEKILELANAYNDAKQNASGYEKELVDIQEQQRAMKEQIQALEYELEQLADDAWARELENSLKVLQNELDILQSKADLSGTNTFDNLEQQAKLYRKLILETGQDLKKYEKKAKEFGNELSAYGFKIEDDGTINNIDEQLLKLRDKLNDTEFGHVEDLLDDYFEYAIDKTADAEKALIDYHKAIEDIEQQKLETTKDIEDEITKMIEKQVEDRIDEIEKERDARVEALDEAQKAYQRWRDETKYEDDYNEQLDKVNKLEAEIEIAKRDTSLAGQKRLADLMEQLKDEQENLEDLVEDKIDEDINNMFDDEKDRIEKTSEQEIEKLKELWSAQNIAEAVSQALSSGIFTDIDGNIMKLDEALLEFANNSEEYLGVMGQTMKEQLLDNLNVALQTMSEMKDIYTTLSSGEYSIALAPMVDGGVINTTGTGVTRTETTNNVSVGDMSIVIQGNADAQTVGQIEALLNEYKNDIYNEILKNMK